MICILYYGLISNSLELELTAKEGSISQQDFEDKIEEAFRQLGIKINV